MTETMQPPTYLEVVERYGLEILNRPADLVVTDTGDIAVTKSGDLMLLSAERSAMFRLVHRWRFNAPTLQLLFDRVSTIKAAAQGAGRQPQRVELRLGRPRHPRSLP